MLWSYLAKTDYLSHRFVFLWWKDWAYWRDHREERREKRVLVIISWAKVLVATREFFIFSALLVRVLVRILKCLFGLYQFFFIDDTTSPFNVNSLHENFFVFYLNWFMKNVDWWPNINKFRICITLDINVILLKNHHCHSFYEKRFSTLSIS